MTQSDNQDGNDQRQAASPPPELSYPPGLKRHYLALLLKYKDDQAKLSGRSVGWLSIRDQIMADEDDMIARQQADTASPHISSQPVRSSLLTADDLRGWFKPASTHLPSDTKFQYIERFIHRLGLAGPSAAAPADPGPTIAPGQAAFIIDRDGRCSAVVPQDALSEPQHAILALLVKCRDPLWFQQMIDLGKNALEKRDP